MKLKINVVLHETNLRQGARLSDMALIHSMSIEMYVTRNKKLSNQTINQVTLVHFVSRQTHATSVSRHLGGCCHIPDVTTTRC